MIEEEMLEEEDLELVETQALELPIHEDSDPDHPQDGIGILYLVATPIGNLGDITLRALDILKRVDLIAAEDTRHSGSLLRHFQITTRQLSYHTHNRRQRIPHLVERLKQGSHIALITDAGMPGISDPGSDLVAACVQAGIPVVPIPGASAGLTGLVASGLSTERFVFEGFLPTANRDRQERLTLLATEPRTILLYEAPHRLERTLQDLTQHLEGSRSITIARELTKRFETFWRGSLDEALVHTASHPPRGEITLVIAGYVAPPVTHSPDMDWIHAVGELMQTGLSRSQACRQLAQEYGLDRQSIYRASLAASGGED